MSYQIPEPRLLRTLVLRALDADTDVREEEKGLAYDILRHLIIGELSQEQLETIAEIYFPPDEIEKEEEDNGQT